MSSEIGNKALLRARAEELQILDRKIFPVNLATDVVQPVLEVNPRYLGPAMGVETVDYNSGIVSLAGVSQVDFEIYPAVADFNTHINAIHARIDVPTDASPSEVQLFIYYELPVGQPFRIVDLKPAFSTAGSLVQYRYALGGSFVVVSGTSSAWDGHVTPLVPLRMSVIKSNGTNFPTGSEVNWSRFASLWPVGSIRPW